MLDSEIIMYPFIGNAIDSGLTSYRISGGISENLESSQL